MDWAPDTCTCGRALHPPNVKVAWTPCSCDRADGRPRGHQYVMCLACRREHRKGGCDRLTDGYEQSGPDVAGTKL